MLGLVAVLGNFISGIRMFLYNSQHTYSYEKAIT